MRQMRMLPACLAVVMLVGTALPQRAVSEELKTGTALRWVPASAAFFSTSLRIKEQWQMFASTKACAKLKSLPIVQMAHAQIKNALENGNDDMKQAKEFWLSPSNKGLRELMLDCVSHEIFMFGDDSFAKSFSMLNQMGQQVNSLQWKMIGKTESEREAALSEEVLKLLKDNLAEVNAPRMVMGFRTSKSEIATAELDRLEGMAKVMLQKVEGGAYAKRLSRSKGDASDMLSFRIDGGMIPWNKIREEAEEEGTEPEQIDQLEKLLKDRELVVGLGINDGYVVLAISPDGDASKLFAKSDLLVDSPKLKLLRDNADKALVSIGYASAEFMRGLAGNNKFMDDAVMALEVKLPELDLDDSVKKQLVADMKELATDIEKVMPKPGAMMGFSYLTKDGYEGYAEDGSENFYLDGSKPLTILDHAGSDPIVVAASRQKLKNPNSGLASKWMHRMGYYLENVLVEKRLSEAQKKLYVAFRDGMGPVCNKLGEATENHMRKAFEDGQMAFVMDAKVTKEQWHNMMPPAETPVALPEMGWVFSVTNRMELEAGLAAYAESAEAMLAKFKELVAKNADNLRAELPPQAQAIPDILPNVNLPKPQSKEIEDGKVLFSSMFQAAGVDPAFAPCMGWNSDAMVFALGPNTAERLLKSSSITGPLYDAKGTALAAASAIDIHRFFGMLRPWVAYGMTIAAQQDESGMVEQFKPQVDTILEIAQCWTNYHSTTAVEGDRMVTRFGTHFKDLED
jgi:hypothetical protein